jgi:hypothetical protein
MRREPRAPQDAKRLDPEGGLALITAVITIKTAVITIKTAVILTRSGRICSCFSGVHSIQARALSRLCKAATTH